MGAEIEFDNVNLNNWTPASTVTVDIGGVMRNVPVDGNGNGNIQRQTHGQDIVPGMTITATDGTTTKTLTVANLRITTLDLDTDVVSGIAPGTTSVHVNIHQSGTPGPPLAQASTVSDGGGNWSIDFTSQFDIQGGMNAVALVTDADNDSTFSSKSPPTVGADIGFDSVTLNRWTPGSTITLNIGGVTQTVTVDGNGNAFIQRSTHGQDIVAGMTITATDGASTKTLTVANLRVVTIDASTDVVSGIAPATTNVFVNINRPGLPGPPLAQANTVSDGAGNWSIDFTSQLDVDSGMSASASVTDPDGDNTFSTKSPPTVGAGIEFDNVNLNNWTPASTVTVDIGGVTRNVPVDGNGNGNIQRSTHGQDIVAGMTISATDGTTTKTLTVVNLAVTTIDVETDIVSGVAPPTTSVNVNVPLGQATVTSDGAGNWSIDFTSRVDIQFGMGAGANVVDADGDSTSSFKTTTVPPPPPPTPLPRPAGAIVIGHEAPGSLDPHVSYFGPAWEIIDQMFVGLTRYDRRTGELGLDLAESYTVSPDLRTWTFTLGEARWSDGQEITADDVAFGIQRAKDPATNGDPNARALLDPIEDATALDPTTVEIELTRPLAYLPALLSIPAARPVPQHAIDEHGSSWLDPGNIVVSGAYTLAFRSPAGIVLERNPEYAGEASIETVVYDTSGASAFAARYLAGELDFVPAGRLGLGPVADVKADPRFAGDLVIGPAAGTAYLLFNAAHGSTANVDVRRALSAATDRVRIATEVLGDASLAATTLTAPNVFGAVPPSAGVGIAFDEVAARAHQQAAGAAFPSSITIRLLGLALSRQRIAAILEEDWERIFGPGFTVDVEVLPAQVVVDQLANPDPSVQAPVTMLGWAIDYPDAHNFLGDAVRFSPPRWSDPTYDALVAHAATTLDEGARLADYVNAERILTETQAALAPLHTLADAFVRRSDLNVVGDRIENWSVGAEARVANVASDLDELVQANPGTPQADKVEDAATKLDLALAELEKTPPDAQAALGNLEGAVGDLEAAHNAGLIDATDLMNELAGVARQLATAAIDDATARGGDAGEIAEAMQLLGNGDALRGEQRFKDAVAKYRAALVKAEGA